MSEKRPITDEEITEIVARYWEEMGLPDNSGGDLCRSRLVEIIARLLRERTQNRVE